MAKKNRIEKSAPRILSKVKTFFTIDLDCPFILGMSGGSTKSFVPERKTVVLKQNISKMPSGFSQTLLSSPVMSFGPPRPIAFQKIPKITTMVMEKYRALNGFVP